MNAPSLPNTVDFYGRDFIINQDVLIPRPETEQIIDSAKNLAGLSYLKGVKPSPRKLPKNPIILDVGTGSGCIAITLQKEIPDATIYATDISEKALKIAKKNAVKHSVTIPLIISYLLDKVKSKQIPIPDMVVANLPYVDPNWDWIDKISLEKEPSIALYAKDHGLALIKELITEAKSLKIKFLILEADPSQHETIIKYAKKAGFDHLETRGFIITLCSLQVSR